MSNNQEAIRRDKPGEILRKAASSIGFMPLVGLCIGAMLVFVPHNYIIVGIGGILFAYLLFTKIEIAVILALLIQNQLGRYNYLGGGTPFHPNGIMGGALIGGTICYVIVNLRKIDSSRLRSLGTFLAFFSICALSILRSGDHMMDSLNVTMRLGTALAIYVVLLCRLDSIIKTQWVIGAIIAAQILPTIGGLMMGAGRTGLLYNEETSRLGDSGVGVYLAMILTLCLAFLLNSDTQSKRYLFGGLTVLYAAGLFFSFGRAGWIGFVVAVCIIGLLKHKKLLLVVPIILALAILLIPAIRQRFASISPEGTGDRTPNTLAHRFEYWKAAFQIIKTNPVIGVGYGVGRYRVGEYRSQYESMIHNDYVSVLLETGLIGFILFLVWHGQWLAAIFKVYRKSEHNYDQALALGAFAVLTASFFMRLTDNLLLDSYKLYPLCALMATTLSLPRIRAAEAEGLSSVMAI